MIRITVRPEITRKFLLAGLPSISVFSLWACTGPQVRAVTVAEQIKETAERVEFTAADIGKLAARFNAADFSKARLRKYSDQSLGNLYEAIGQATFYFPDDPSYVNFQEHVLEEKIRRGIQRAFDLKDMHQTYVASRDFDKAGRLRGRFPSLKFPSIPETIMTPEFPEGTPWQAYEISEGGRKAELIRLDLGKGARIVMVMHTGCSVAERALGQILDDGDAAGDFRELGYLVTRRFDSYGVSNWKEHFRFPNVFIADKTYDFPGFKFDSSPIFYFLRDGEIVSSFEGWSRESGENNSLSQLKKELESIR